MLRDNCHSWSSFKLCGFKEITTWLGIILICGGWYYHKEIDILIRHILASPELVTKIINGLGTLVGFLFILYKEKIHNGKSIQKDYSNNNH